MTWGEASISTVMCGMSSILVVVLAATPSPALAFDQALAEDQLDVLINDARATEGLPLLEPRDDLAAVARERSQDMAMNDYFSHDPPDGSRLDDLLNAAGLDYELGAEIIARNNRPDTSSVQTAFSGWLNSPAHRDIMFDSRYSEMGVGSWSGPGGMHYYTVLFLEGG
ncbi:MAG TPA: CAP domain-containing protein [Chloroflexota bacterium]|nr:CAP domain-containing protein [Chloroflexota bacterium]